MTGKELLGIAETKWGIKPKDLAMGQIMAIYCSELVGELKGAHEAGAFEPCLSCGSPKYSCKCS